MFDSLPSAFDRRQLLAGGSAAVAATLLAQLLPRASAQANSGISLGLVTYQWGKDMSLEEVISSCEKSGLQGVELRTEHKHAVEPSLSKARRSEVRKPLPTVRLNSLAMDPIANSTRMTQPR